MSRRYLKAEERAEIVRRIELRRLYSIENLMIEFECSRAMIDKLARSAERPVAAPPVRKMLTGVSPGTRTRKKRTGATESELADFVERTRQLS